MNSKIQCRPKIKKKLFLEFIFGSKTTSSKLFSKIFIFLRNKVLNHPIIFDNKKTVKLTLFLKIHDRTHDILVDYVTKFSLLTQNLKNANYKNTIKKFPCE